jgi:AraC family transcriptional regulator
MSIKLLKGRFYGETLMSREISGLRLFESVYVADLVTPKHTHELAHCCLVLEGGGLQTYGTKIRLLKPQATFFHLPGDPQAERFGSAGVRLFCLEMSERWFCRIREYSDGTNISLDFQGGVVASLGLRLYREFRRMDGVSPLVIEGLALELMAEFIRPAPSPMRSRPPIWLERAKEILHSQFTEPLNLASVAASVGVHPVYLAQAFHKFYGKPVGEYLRRLRVEFACREISAGARLLEVALSAGFSDQSHFSRAFRNSTGMTPSEYRRNFKKS